MPYCLQLMRREDITQVTEIDREAFPTLWPPSNYQREIQNHLAHHIVVYDEEQMVASAQVKPRKGRSAVITRVLNFLNHGRFFGNRLPPTNQQYIIGFAGLWIMADEAHITNIAVRESYRRQGIGELLLISVIDLATKLEARFITLEVRASNTAAQTLYSKYGFAGVGLRHGYYIDNKENAILMSTEEIASTSFQSRLHHLKEAHFRKLAIASYQVAP